MSARCKHIIVASELKGRTDDLGLHLRSTQVLVDSASLAVLLVFKK